MQNISTRAMFAEPTLLIAASEKSNESAIPFTLDTTFVLFFLAMDLGLVSLTMSVATVLQVATLVVFLVVPYFLPFTGDHQDFSRWLVGRIVVGAVGITFGLMLGQAIGTVLPDAVRFVPMTLLIVAAIICCNVQIYGILKHRLAR
ncbi:MAG: hypothetical protein PSX80_16250 [bacterium]|nr:hypothetical protein [bacterium]